MTAKELLDACCEVTCALNRDSGFRAGVNLATLLAPPMGLAAADVEAEARAQSEVEHDADRVSSFGWARGV